MRKLPTALPAIITPFDQDLDLDTDAHEHNIAHLASQGCTGYLVAGSTGEGPYLDPGERATLVSSTRRAGPDAAILCGVNGESVHQALRQIDEAAGAGADAALVATPTTLIRGNDELVAGFYTQVAGEAEIPILLYTVPAVTGYALPTRIIAMLSSHPNIVGTKDSGGDPSRLDDLADAIASGFVIFAGASRALAASHRLGAHGAITASANYAFDLVEQAAGGHEDAQSSLIGLTSIIEPHGRAGTKYAASATGLIGGRLRPPLVSLGDAERREIDHALDSRKRLQPE